MKTRLVAATFASALAIAGPTSVLTACTPGPPPVNCEVSDASTNIHDRGTGYGVAHVYFGVSACWEANGTLTQWNPYFSLQKYGPFAGFICTSNTPIQTPQWQTITGEFSVSAEFGYAGYGFCTGTGTGRCFDSVRTPGFIMPEGMDCNFMDDPDPNWYVSHST